MENTKKMLQDEEDALLKEQEAEDLRAAKEAMRDKEKMDLLIGQMTF